MSRGALAHCPYCEGPARVRNSIPVTMTHRDMYFYCRNPKCGHTWKAQLSFVYSIRASPSSPIVTGGAAATASRRPDWSRPDAGLIDPFTA